MHGLHFSKNVVPFPALIDAYHVVGYIINNMDGAAVHVQHYVIAIVFIAVNQNGSFLFTSR